MPIDNYTPDKELLINPGNGNKPYWKDLTSLNKTYFSGLDASIYFNDIYISSMISLEYQLQEMVLPLYSYADFTMRRAVHGQRRVFGSFTINFQQVYLFYLILEYLSGINISTTKNQNSSITKNKYITPSNGKILSDIVSTLTQPFNQTNTSPPNLHPVSQASLNQVEMLKNASLILQSQKDSQSFQEDLAFISQSQKDLHWNQKKQKNKTDETALLSAIQSRITNLLPKYETSSQGFDININFGSANDTQVELLTQDSSNIFPTGFTQSTENSISQFSTSEGNKKLNAVISNAPPFSLRKLIGVEITGESSSVNDSGTPVLITYSFICKDLI